MQYIYFDNAATSFPKPHCVVESVTTYLKCVGASPARSAHRLSIKAGEILYDTRLSLAELLGQKRAERIIFGANATTMLNSVLYGLIEEGDKVISTSLEHNSVIRPLMNLKKNKSINLEIIQANAYCELELSVLESHLKDSKICICVYANNVTGAVLPIHDIYTLCKKYNVIFILDASQAVGHLPLKADYADIICGSCHKGLYAPSSLGFMSLNPHFNEEMLDSFMQGGSGSKSEIMLQPSILPDKYESGTPNMCAIAGLNASLKWIKQNGGISALHADEMNLYRFFYDNLKTIEGIKLQEIKSKNCVANISFNIKGISPSSTGLELDKQFGILTRVGLHCSPLTHKTIDSFKSGGSVRVSIGAFNTNKEVEYALDCIQSIAKHFK